MQFRQAETFLVGRPRRGLAIIFVQNATLGRQSRGHSPQRESFRLAIHIEQAYPHAVETRIDSERVENRVYEDRTHSIY